jgi:hypothetical protein
MADWLKVPRMSACSAPSRHLISSSTLKYITLRDNKNIGKVSLFSHNKEIGDWHDLLHLAGILQSSKGEQRLLQKISVIWNGNREFSDFDALQEF